MNKILLVILFYGFGYYLFEAIFNFLTIDLFNKNKTWKEKLRLKTDNAPSFWMITDGSVCGLLLYLLFLIPFTMNNVFVFISVCLLGGLIITGVELGSGMLFNVLWKLNLWDYSNSKIKIFGKEILLNFKGQIDVYHSLAWCLITILMYLTTLLFK